MLFGKISFCERGTQSPLDRLYRSLNPSRNLMNLQNVKKIEKKSIEDNKEIDSFIEKVKKREFNNLWLYASLVYNADEELTFFQDCIGTSDQIHEDQNYIEMYVRRTGDLAEVEKKYGRCTSLVDFEERVSLRGTEEIRIFFCQEGVEGILKFLMIL